MRCLRRWGCGEGNDLVLDKCFIFCAIVIPDVATPYKMFH